MIMDDIYYSNNQNNVLKYINLISSFNIYMYILIDYLLKI